MKKERQYSDKYGKVIEVGEVPEKRGTSGVTLLSGAYELTGKKDAAANLSPEEEKVAAAEQLDENPNANAGPKEEKAVAAKKAKNSKSE